MHRGAWWAAVHGSESQAWQSNTHGGPHGGLLCGGLLNEMSQELRVKCFCSNLQCPDGAARR